MKLVQAIRKEIKHSFDNLRNEKLKYSLLQAIPFWIGSVITGTIAVIYAQLFVWGEKVMNLIFDWNGWMIFIIAPIGFVLSWWLIQKFAPYAKGSGIPQVMAAVELANPKENSKIKHLLSLKILIIKILSSLALILGGGARLQDPYFGKSTNIFQIGGPKFQRKT